MKIWTWLKENWWVPLVAIAAVLGAILGGGRPDKTVKRELKAVQQGKAAAQLAVETSTEFAIRAIEDNHKKTIEAFDETQKKKMEGLRNDPRALAAALSRLSE